MVLGQKEEAAAVLAAMAGIHAVSTSDGAIEAEYEGDDAVAAGLLQSLIAAGIKVSSFSQLDGGLEDAFMRATSEDGK